MKHFGDITKIRAVDVPPVNVVIGGSPCQDLSVAGKQAGMTKECENHNCDYRTAGNTKLEKCPVCGAWLRLTRSGLFMEQVRIIKEMRRADTANGRTGENIRPRFMVWENVPGAFSSHKGADFSAVLQETARIVCEKAPAVPVPKNGWPTAGCITGMGDGGDSSVLRGAYLTRSFGESPSVAVVSHLSLILQVSPPPKYSLSATACKGILRRAERRGKKLPEILIMALQQMIAREESSRST